MSSKKSIDWFEDFELVGRGNFSEIYKAKDKKSGLYYAIKKYNKRRIKSLNKELEIEMEKYCLQKLKGTKYIIEYFD